MVTLYGIKNCDTVKKARNWLDEHRIGYRFHDFKTNGLTQAQLQAFAEQLGWETLLNRNSTSWRQLPEQQRLGLDASTALALMLNIPTLIKRPVLVTENRTLIGFKSDLYAVAFNLTE